jgi:hypothetical protein
MMMIPVDTVGRWPSDIVMDAMHLSEFFALLLAVRSCWRNLQRSMVVETGNIKERLSILKYTIAWECLLAAVLLAF